MKGLIIIAVGLIVFSYGKVAAIWYWLGIVIMALGLLKLASRYIKPADDSFFMNDGYSDIGSSDSDVGGDGSGGGD